MSRLRYYTRDITQVAKETESVEEENGGKGVRRVCRGITRDKDKRGRLELG